jgi:6-phosphogluconolactonase (cycloisomerase 2 family)
MKKKSALILVGLLASSLVFANQPVTMSGPVPALAPSYGAGISRTLVYTITNKVPKSLPITIEGLSGSLTRTPVFNDCGTVLLPAQGTIPSVCNLGISITSTQAEVGSPVNQMLRVNYQGRKPLQADISFLARQPMLYVTNFASNSVSQCLVNLETGVISQCLVFSDPTFNSPSAIVVNPSGTQVYVTNSGNGTISECFVQANGGLSSCTSGNGVDEILDSPSGLALNPAGTLLYTADFSTNTVSVCSIDSAGGINNCTTSVPGPLNLPDDIVIDPQNQFAYITNYGANAILRCPIEANGNLGTCTQSNPTFAGPTGITINSAGTTLYINNDGANTVSVCPVLPGAEFLGPCTSSNPDGNFNISFGKNALYNSAFLFVANSGGNVNLVSVCSLNSQGGLMSCPASNPDSTFDTPQGVALN